MRTLRPALLSLVARLVRLVSWVVLRTVPSRPHAVVHGWPDNEGNAVEVVRGLLRRYSGRVYWLLQEPDRVDGGDPPLARDPRLVRLAKDSPAALWAMLTAEVTFFTHGLLTAVRPPADRLVVNLWHGDGPKSTQRAELVKSTVVVSGAALWAAYKGPLFDVPPERVLVTGNPRIDQFDRVPSDAALRRLGLEPGRPRVLWMPTFREARGPRGRVWTDGTRLSDSGTVRELASVLAEHARALSLDLVIKPHPLDGDAFEGLGCLVVQGEHLDAAGVSLYQLLGQCDALLSDVSSAWVDYLVLDRPVGFYVPDLADLERLRGLNVPDFASLMPGMRIEDAEQACAFLDRVVSQPDSLRPSRYPGWARIGAVDGTGATDRLLDALSDVERARGRAPLFDASRTGARG